MLSDSVFSVKASQRINRLKDKFLATKPEMCIERAILVTQAYQEYENQPVIVKRALALKKVLENITIFIDEDELIVGHPASKPRSAEVFPEMSVHWVKEELDDFETREHNRLKVSEETKEKLRQIYSYWKGKTVCDHLVGIRDTRIQQAIDCGLLSNPHQWSGLAHVALNFKDVLNKGFVKLKQEIQQKKMKIDLTDPEYLKHKAFYDAAEIVCDAAINFSKRFSKLAAEMALNEINEQRKLELESISKVCERVPAYPATSFHEALQSFWFAQLIPQIESNGFSITPGRFDHYMYPFYKNDIEKGILTQEHAQELLECVWLKFSEILRVDDKGAAEVNAGYASGQNLVVGGIGPDGRDVTNELSYMCLLANVHIGLHQPNFTVRLHKGSPDELLERTAEVIGCGNGMPQLLNDELIVPALLNIGIPLKEARDYIPVGCDEITVEGMWGRCNGGYINFPKVLEVILNKGKCAITEKNSGLFINQTDNLDSFEELLDTFKRQLKEGIRLLAAEANNTDIIHEKLAPLPFVSVLVSGCIDKGLDVTQGGAKYNFTGPVGVGSASIGDSLLAIKKVVFEQDRISLKDFIKLLKNNFKDNEVLRQYIKNKIPKFGNDVDEVDNLVVEVTNTFFDELDKYRNPRGGRFIAALYSVTAQVGLGNKTAATPDGRLAYEPLSDGLSPMYGCDTLGPTAALKSVTKVDLIRAINGVIVNQRLSPSILKTKSGIMKFKQLLRSFVDLGGFHWQFNVVSTDLLIDAQNNPDKYRGLVVRVAGYSAIFVELSKKAQDSVIARTVAEI